MGTFAIIFLSIIFLLALLFLLDKKTKRDFESKGVYYVGNGTYRFILNSLKGIGFVESFSFLYTRLKSANAKVAGGLDFGQPTLIIIDPELIKSVLVKDFDHFVDRRTFDFPKQDYLFAKMVSFSSYPHTSSV